MKRRLFMSALLSPVGIRAASGRRLAVLDFEFAAVKGRASALTGKDIDLGRGIADLLMTRLIGTGQLTVIDRKSLDKLIAEQNLSNSTRFDSAAAARIGRLLGVDAIVVGGVTALSGGGLDLEYSRWARLIPVVGSHIPNDVNIRSRKENTVIQMNYRMLSVETGEALAGGDIRGEGSRLSSISRGAGTQYGLDQTVIGEAVRDAVEKMAQNLNAHAARMEPAKRPVSGEVLSAVNGRIVVNLGTKQGVTAGDRLRVEQVTFQGTDSSGKKVKLTEVVGHVTLTRVDEEASVGTFAGEGEPRTGDAVNR